MGVKSEVEPVQKVPTTLWWKDDSFLQRFLCQTGLAAERPEQSGKSRFLYPSETMQGDPELACGLWNHFDVF